ncbi:expressed unknown protein [Seminavis robusta]|uniref:Uncharacterized protein n=1 Tax=Seminavis robusta TaxID=568900 RepID=A0A9N8HIF5_9STRA|nr:expressed unknown protein [Seminavis robusta]|eukprot:Sro780_g201430.1 n/a (304) ;mRNA; r:11216-12127
MFQTECTRNNINGQTSPPDKEASPTLNQRSKEKDFVRSSAPKLELASLSHTQFSGIGTKHSFAYKTPTMSSLCNQDAKIAFFAKSAGEATAVSNETLSNIARGIQHGIQRCIDRTSDVDMFVCLQGNKIIPNTLPIRLEDIQATMETASNGDLKFKTLQGNHTLHVLFTGGGSQFSIQLAEPPQRQQARVPQRQQARVPQQQQARVPQQQQARVPRQQQRQQARTQQPAPPQAERRSREASANRHRVSLTDSSESSDEEEVVAPLRRYRRAGQQQKRQPDSDDSSSADEYKNFSQITGRKKRA